MSENLDHKTFDLAAVLAGRDYPETVVSVYFDEKLGFTITKLREAIAEAGRRGDDDTATDLQKDLDELVLKVKSAEYKVHMTGIPEGVKNGLLATTRKEFPTQRDLFGRPEDDLEADRVYTRRLWAAMIVKIEDPSGAVSFMNEELAKTVLDKAPKSAQTEISRAVNELNDGATAGFEFAARQVDFLSIA